MLPVEVTNKASLLGHGPHNLRSDAIKIIEAAIRNADPYLATYKTVRRQGDLLSIGKSEYDLSQWEQIYILGTGKATHAIALALEEILGDRLTNGLVVLKHGEQSRLQKIRVIYAAHPVPDEGSLLGGQELMSLARQAGEKDLVISAITGGSSSLAILPPEGISLADVQDLNRLLLNCGASIFEINAVRKHASQIKGGRLAQEIFPAELVSLTVSDVVGDAYDYITDLTVPDTSTYQDAWNTLDKYQLWEVLPAALHTHLLKGPETESPKSFTGRYQTFLLVPGDAAYQGAVRRCRELGYQVKELEREIVGESWEEARKLVACAMISFYETNTPCALLAAGETTVTITGQYGKGGPNMEFALSAALEIEGSPDIVVAAIDVDGTDGPTRAAGGLVDGLTIARARQLDFDPDAFLKEHASYDFLSLTDDLILTGPTGTNVNDVMFVLRRRG